MKKLNYIVPVLFLFSSTITLAQFDVDVYTEVGIPTGEFRENTKAEGYGFGLTFLYALDSAERQISIGLATDYQIYGKKTSNSNGWRVTANNNMLAFHAVLRFRVSTQGAINPYVDVLGGMKYFYTRSNIREDIFTEPVETSTDFKDTIPSYGVALGFIFNSSGMVSFNIQGGILRGGKGEYLDAESIELINPDEIVFTPKFSRTNLTMLKAGVNVRLD